MPDLPDSLSEGPGDTPGAEAQCWLDVDVLLDAGVWPEFDDLSGSIAAAARALAAHRAFDDCPPATAAIALSSDATVHRLNAEYRGKDKPTNVLSFPAPNAFAGTDDDAAMVLGDIVLAEETVRSEAADLALPLADHVRHLAVHGILHLLGYDHETDDEAGEMEALEIEILASIGVADPYADRARTETVETEQTREKA